MSAGIHLVGGGWGGDARVWRAFVAEATALADGVPRIAVVSVRDGDEDEHAVRLVAAVRAAEPIEPVVIAVREGTAIGPAAFDDDLHGVLVGGGLTPAYRDALEPAFDRIRALHRAGRPYAGFSAGSAIAAEHALLGGWLHRGTPVVDEEVGEELGELTVLPGIGLVPFAVDVHAAQWGTTSRLMTAVEAGLVATGVAIDEDTAVVLRDGLVEVVGTGSAWWIAPADGGVHVRREAGR